MVVRVVESLGLRFGDDSLEVLDNFGDGDPVEDWMVEGRRFRRVRSLTVLGVALDSVASTAHMVAHRIRKSEAVWQRCGAALRDGTLFAATRWRLWLDTVGTSVLWGSAVWRPTSTLQQMLTAFEARAGRRMLQITRRSTEDWLVYFRRRRTAVTTMQRAAARDTLFQMCGRTVHRWMGHVARTRVDPLPAILR